MGCRCGEAKLVGQRVLIIEQQAVLPPANGEVQVNTQVAKLYQQYHSGLEQVAAQYAAYASSQLSVDSLLKSFDAGAASNRCARSPRSVVCDAL